MHVRMYLVLVVSGGGAPFTMQHHFDSHIVSDQHPSFDCLCTLFVAWLFLLLLPLCLLPKTLHPPYYLPPASSILPPGMAPCSWGAFPRNWCCWPSLCLIFPLFLFVCGDWSAFFRDPQILCHSIMSRIYWPYAKNPLHLLCLNPPRHGMNLPPHSESKIEIYPLSGGKMPGANPQSHDASAAARGAVPKWRHRHGGIMSRLPRCAIFELAPYNSPQKKQRQEFWEGQE